LREAFAEADAAIAASGTVILELGLAGVPVISTYSTDWIVKLLHKRIKAWTAALPNLIADYVLVPEQINEMLRPGVLARWLERLSSDTLQRRAMLEGFDLIWQRLFRGRQATHGGKIAAHRFSQSLRAGQVVFLTDPVELSELGLWQ